MGLTPRCHKIMERLAEHGEVSVNELAEAFNVTTMTIRRDLEYLESCNMLTRTHGGAVFSRPAVVEFTFLERSRTHMTEKQAIGLAAAELVKPGMSVVLDTGTTTLEVARAIVEVPDLRILTSSLPIASALYVQENITVILLGGTIRRNEPNLSGALTEDNLRRFRADLAIVGVDAASPQGMYTTDLEIARVSRTMIETADQAVVVADSSKFERSSFVKYADWKDVHRVITDNKIAETHLGWLREAARDVQLVEG